MGYKYVDDDEDDLQRHAPPINLKILFGTVTRLLPVPTGYTLIDERNQVDQRGVTTLRIQGNPLLIIIVWVINDRAGEFPGQEIVRAGPVIIY